MFGILDSLDRPPDGVISKTSKSMSIRACDQCKHRKIRCNDGRPCVSCTTKGLRCTYNVARKKRGPPTKKSLFQCQERSTLAVSETAAVQCYIPTETKTPESEQILIDHPSVSVTSPSMDQTTPLPRREVTNDVFGHQVPADAQPYEQIAPGEDAGTCNLFPSEHHEDFILPSLPLESPTTSLNDYFGGMSEQHFPPLPSPDVWPVDVNEATMFPWIDVYFKRLHPTVPIVSRSNLYCDMLLRKHHVDPQYGAMLLGLSAFAMTQPVQIHERASIPSRSVQARMLMEACVKMRVTADFGEFPTIEMVLASFFLFACLFGNSQHKAARHRLREAVDLAHCLGLHLPSSYAGLEIDTRKQWLRTYLVLSVTERAYALQQHHQISFRGQPGITARFMQSFDPALTNEYISSLLYQERSDTLSMTGLLYLMDTFDAIDESVMDCWNGYCKLSDGICETFDRRQAVKMFRAQRLVREACVSGNVSFAPGIAPTPLAQLLDTQRADITVTQYWLLSRLWQLCLSHHLLHEISDHAELRFDFACHIALATLHARTWLTLAAMEVHGVGFAEKLYDVAMGVVTALNASSHMHLETIIRPTEDSIDADCGRHYWEICVRELLDRLRSLLRDFRGGDHEYAERLQSTLVSLPGFAT